VCRGTNEAFQVKSRAPSLDIFGETSPMEHVHVAIVSAAFNLEPFSFMDNITADTSADFVRLVRRLILVRPPQSLSLSG
jgi:hypothetical protein